MADENSESLGVARASPTKEFFVRMLTRDIELGDAVLDLLDNCLDGILRSRDPNRHSDTPYKGFYANLILGPDEFVIEDNCGGIPLETARQYAFAMGRPPGAGDDTPATIGMYGIGMKRAIFKLGTNAIVESQHDSETGFFVEFTPEWMAEDGWEDLPIHRLDRKEMEEPGTRITVLELNDEAKRFFSEQQNIDEFRKTVSRHYSLILAKGFSVKIGSREEIERDEGVVHATPFRFLASEQDAAQGERIEPFVYIGQIDGVSVEIYAGLYRPLLTQEELDLEEERRGSTEEAGWTVACNDRIVIWKDKSRLTGWGEATVPNFHGQFIPITGIVLMYAEDPRLLPLTTTKRGIDAASNVYSSVKDLMREATKELTKFTNRWKKFPGRRDDIYESSPRIGLSELRQNFKSDDRKTNPLRRFEAMRAFKPILPHPAQERTDARISFTARKADIELVARYYFEDTSSVTNEDVGKACFGAALKCAKGS